MQLAHNYEPCWKEIPTTRLGPQYRSQSNRFFLIKHCGWFVSIRGECCVREGIEMRSGMSGPFTTYYEAKQYLTNLLSDNGVGHQQGQTLLNH